MSLYSCHGFQPHFDLVPFEVSLYLVLGYRKHGKGISANDTAATQGWRWCSAGSIHGSSSSCRRDSQLISQLILYPPHFFEEVDLFSVDGWHETDICKALTYRKQRRAQAAWP